MIICVCNTLKDKDLRKACKMGSGCKDAEEVMSGLGCKPQCGSCLCYIEDIMMEENRPV